MMQGCSLKGISDQRWAMYIKKSILYTIYRYSQIFAQNIQYTYTLRILENIQYTIYSCLKKYIQYAFRIYFKKLLVRVIKISCTF